MELAKSLGGDTRIVEAVINSQRGHKGTALRVLKEVDSTEARSTALAIAGSHDGQQRALDWLNGAGLSVSDLSPDGKFVFLKYQLELGQWEGARESIESLCESDMEESPILHHPIAMSHLLSTVSPDYRNAVLRHVPFNASVFPLDSGAAAIEARRIARGHFLKAAKLLQEFDCPQAAVELDGYALWLELRDSEYYESGKQRLEAKFNDVELPLYLVSLGLQYGVRMDLAEVEQEIERQGTPQGGITLDGAFARLALARAQRKPEDAASYIARHYDSLVLHFDAKLIRSIHIEMLAQAGLTERASECLELLSKEGLSDSETSRLSIAIEEGAGKDTLEDRKALFKTTGSPTDLEALANQLEASEAWDELCKYAEILYEGTGYVRDAERLANALHLAGNSARVAELLESNVDLRSQSTYLQMIYCWALYHEGELLQAQRELEKLDDDWEDENYRTLRISLAIAIGDWETLSLSIASWYKQTENKSAIELIKAAELSLYLKSPSARELLFAAAAQGKEDAGVLSNAYFLATRAGWEVNSEIASWLHRAAELSGEDGPLWSVTPREFLDMMPDWDRQELSIRQLLNRGEAPMYFAAQFLNRSLINLTLFPALTNSDERDLRRKVGVPAFSGQRRPSQYVASGTIGLDYTSLITLGFLGLLDKVFDAFDTVFVPHSAHAWLFEEKLNASFHQPSRIKDARQIRDLIAEGLLERVSHSTTADRELSVQVGDELALLIAEAENAIGRAPQRLVVRPNPVYEITSLGQVEVDLTAHSGVLSSCQAVISKLYDLGEIDESARRNAFAFMKLKEKPWPHQPEITDEAFLYLDYLAIYYFLRTGILEKLCKTEFRLVVSPGAISEIDALIAYGRKTDKVIGAIEDLREIVSRGIKAERVKVGKWRSIDEGDEQAVADHHLIGMLALTEDCDAIIADDRFFNKHQVIDHKGVQTPVCSTLDLLDALVSAGLISPEKRLECRTRLRHAGFQFIPLGEDELNLYLNDAGDRDGKLIERAPLKGIRESILHARMSDWLQLPKEEFWLETIFGVSLNVLRHLWQEGADVPSVRVRSDWIMDLIEVRGWAHCFESESRDGIIEAGRARIIFELLTPLDSEVPQNIREAYWEWLEDRILAPIRDMEPDLYTQIVDSERRRISEVADTILNGVVNNEG